MPALRQTQHGAQDAAGGSRASAFETLADVLRARAQERPDGLAYLFLSDGEREGDRLTFAELDEKARAIAAELERRNAATERVLLLCPPGLEYAAAFFGCIYASAVAVPIYPPRPNRSMHRIHAIAEDCQAKFALTTSVIHKRVEPALAEYEALRRAHFLTVDGVEQRLGEAWSGRRPGAGDVAFLQYTSGSTALPKGVMVSHANLMHNEEMIKEALGSDEQSCIVSWLPIFHDMGLIGCVLQAIYAGSPCVMMSPLAFLQRPMRWLKAISRYKGAISYAPNFAYDLCVSKVTDEQKASLDLSHWRVALNGAEPVRPETLERFAEAFSQCGFKKEAIYPGYGLAEATLMVSGGQRQTMPRCYSFDAKALEKDRVVEVTGGSASARTLVSCGTAWLDQQIAIVDPDTLTECPPGRVGEIWVSGNSVARGYWNRPEESEQTFRARIKGGGERRFLRTGDLGFMHNGELIITGRLKDLIIIAGYNHYPQDIELTVEQSHAALRPGCSAAFSIDVDGEERLAVAAEVDHLFVPKSEAIANETGDAGPKQGRRRRSVDPNEIIKSARQMVAKDHDVMLHNFVLLKAGSLPKTSSGKVQRRATRKAFVEGGLELWSPVTSPDQKV